MRELKAGCSTTQSEQDDGDGGPGSEIPFQTSVTDVPDELLQLCFARMPLRFLHRVKAVCKRWHNLGHSDQLRKLRKALGLTEPWTLVLTNRFEKNAVFRGLQGHAFDLTSEASLPICTLDTPHRVLFGVTVGTNGIVYIFGGRSPLISGKPKEWEVFTRVDAYDPFRNCWSPVPAMRTARYGFAAGAYIDSATDEAKLIVVGGYDAHGQALPFAEVFDVQREEWEHIPSMLRLSGACRGKVVNGRFYVAQANADPHYVEEYNPVNRSWSCYSGPDKIWFQEPSSGCAVSLHM